MPQISTRRAEPKDSAAISRIQQLSPEASQWPVGDYSNYKVIVAVSDEDVVVGFCAYRQTLPTEAELLNFGVDPAHRRQGIGSALLEELERSTTGELYLEVAETNEAALRLYGSSGWEPIGKRTGYYAGGTINAVVMKKGSCYRRG